MRITRETSRSMVGTNPKIYTSYKSMSASFKKELHSNGVTSLRKIKVRYVGVVYYMLDKNKETLGHCRRDDNGYYSVLLKPQTIQKHTLKR